jgi:ATP-dependent NAD(P)H-hydrate dehydratase
MYNDQIRSLFPPLRNSNLRKGDCGRVCIFGGSEEYSGAPYYAGITALKVVCTQ